MPSSNYDYINEYINERVNRDKEARELISDFALLWNQYERTIFDGYHHIRDVRNKIDVMNIRILDVDNLLRRFKKYLKYRNIEYKSEYIKEAYRIKYNENFSRAYFEHIMKSKEIKDKLEFLLIIIARVRNNMFHGTKGPWELTEQKELFRICNETLMKVLEATYNLYT